MIDLEILIVHIVLMVLNISWVPVLAFLQAEEPFLFGLRDDVQTKIPFLGMEGGICGTSFYGVLNSTPHPNIYQAHSHCISTPNCNTSSTFPQTTEWKNWIITTGNDTTRFYVNGTLIHTCEGIDFDGTNVSGKDFVCGSSITYTGKGPYADNNVKYLKGSLDDIVIYDTILYQNDVNSLYAYFQNMSTFQCVPLPVIFLYFSVQIQGKDAHLTWATASEQNSKEFFIERSLNGRNFTAMGTVPAAGNSSQTTNYRYIDLHAMNLTARQVYFFLCSKHSDKTKCSRSFDNCSS